MRIRDAALWAALALATGLCPAASHSARAENDLRNRPRVYEGLSCANFRQNPDGSWTPLRRVTIVGPNGPFTVEPGQVFRIQLEGTTNYNVKIAETLDDICH
jgi:hypothetical protein